MTKANDDAWNVAEGNQGGKPRQIRYRPEINVKTVQKMYPKLLTITWEYEPNNIDNSLPYSDDIELMQSFETKITDSLEEKGVGIITYIFTGNGQREFFFYINDINAVSDILNTTIEPGLPIQLSVEDDNDWQEYKGILDLVS